MVATDISADGLTIVGQAINPDACELAFLICLPRNTCVADIDQTGTLTIQDVFEFLNLYFAADLRADINQADGVTLQDIFDFVTAFFVSCSRAVEVTI